jgi:hypothetical protein
VLPSGPMRDTSEAANRRYHELLRARAPHERLAQAMALSRMTRELAMAGLRSRHPTASAAELDVRLAARLYGRETALRLFGTIPEDAV